MIPENGRADRSAGFGVLLVACVSAVAVNANSSAVLIMLPEMSADLGVPIVHLQRAVTGYLLVSAVLIVTSGVLGDVFGRRQVFLAGLALFIASSVLIALSGSEWGVIGGRLIQGAAASTLLVCGMSLLSSDASGVGEMRAVTLWGAASASGTALGPLVGGLLVTTAGWRGVFWLNAAIAAACVPVTLLCVRESRDPDRRSVDFAGSALIGLAVAPLVLALSEGTNWGWLSFQTAGCLVLSVTGVVGFVFAEHRVAVPLIDLHLFRNANLVGSATAILIAAGAMDGILFLLSLYLQEPSGLGMSALQAGLAVLPAAVAVIAIAPVITPLARKIGTQGAIMLGFGLAAVAVLVLSFVSSSWSYVVFIALLLVTAVGLGLANSTASSVSVSAVAVAPAKVGEAAGIANMARYVGGALAVAATATAYSGVTNQYLEAGVAPINALAAGLSQASVVVTGLCAAGIGVASLIAPRRPKRMTGAVHVAAAAAARAHTIPTQHLAGATQDREQ